MAAVFHIRPKPNPPKWRESFSSPSVSPCVANTLQVFISVSLLFKLNCISSKTLKAMYELDFESNFICQVRFCMLLLLVVYFLGFLLITLILLFDIELRNFQLSLKDVQKNTN